MKKITILFLLLGASAMIFGQQNETKASSLKQDYLGKSKRQKTAAWVLVAGGAALITVGAVIDSGEREFNLLCLCYVGENDGTKGLLIAGGIGAFGGSVPLFLASARNKRKAMSLTFKGEPAYTPFKIGILNSTIPSFTLKLSL